MRPVYAYAIASSRQLLFGRVVVVRREVCQQSNQRQFFAEYRCFSKAIDAEGGNNDEETSSSSSPPILESASATMQWKRNQYRKIEERFQEPTPPSSDGGSDTTAESTEQSTTTTRPSFPAWPTDNDKPLPIYSDDDVQPMWKGMESRVTKRKALTEADLARKGVSSGRNNVRKSDEDLWLAAGVYGDESNDKDKSNKN